MGKGGAIRWTDDQLAEFEARKASPLVLNKIPNRAPLPAAPPVSAGGEFYALGRMTKGKMNKTEARYAQLLDARKVDGSINDWKFHAIRIRLADNTFYEPDFIVQRSDGEIQIHEVKGSFTTDKGQLKVKLAAEVLPWFRVIKCSWHAKEQAWHYHEFNVRG